MNKNKIKNVKAIAFDLDGTLVDSLDDLAHSANATRQFFNKPKLGLDRIKEFVGNGIPALVHRALADDINQEVDESTWEKGFKYFSQYYNDHLTDNTKPYHNVRTGLKSIQTLQLPLVIITNKNDFFTKKILENLNLIDYFSLIIGGNTLEEKKPSALPILHTSEVLNVPAQNILMVGDSKNDILTSNKAHAMSLFVTYGYGDLTQLEKDKDITIDASIDDFIKVYDVVKNANQE